MSHPRQVAVLGGNGELGSYLCPKLVSLGHDVVAVNNDALPPYTKAAPEWHKVLLPPPPPSRLRPGLQRRRSTRLG
jgi:nucleoside-diphosphate-sugar epimerase